MHQKYKNEWNTYPQYQETRSMELAEFIWSECKPTGNYRYDMNNPTDNELYYIAQSNKQTYREYLAEFDELTKTKSPFDSNSKGYYFNIITTQSTVSS